MNPTVATDPVQLGRRLVKSCVDRGFAFAGICAALPTARESEFREWVAAAAHGDMDFLEEYLSERMDPRRLLPGARAMLLVADRYARPAGEQSPHAGPLGAPGAATGRIAKYAQGRDYHLVVKKRLHALADSLRPEFPGAEFRSFVDTAPVLEREHAARAGLGWVGKHTLLIHPTGGSYFVLGGILTTLDARAEPESQAQPDRCGSCTRCIDACPTGAITPYRVEATRCISYLTIERAGAIEPELAGKMGDWLFGCDICQDVCPYNQPRAGEPAGAINPAYAARTTGLDALEVLSWSAADRTARLSGSAMKRATLDMLKRNALIVLANAARRTGDARLLAAVDRAAADAGLPEWVRGHARV